jgi:hypothetical protein
MVFALQCDSGHGEKVVLVVDCSNRGDRCRYRHCAAVDDYSKSGSNPRSLDDKIMITTVIGGIVVGVGAVGATLGLLVDKPPAELRRDRCANVHQIQIGTNQFSDPWRVAV